MDGILEEIGQCKRFQVCQVTLIQLCRFINGWVFSVMIFGLYNPGWRCATNNIMTITQNTTNISTGTGGMASFQYSSMSPLDQNYQIHSNYPNTAYLGLHSENSFNNNSIHNLSIASSNYYNESCDVINSCGSIEFNPASSTVVSEFGLVCDKIWIGFTIVSILNGGMVCGAVVMGRVGERFGRKVGLYASQLLITLVSGLAVFSPVWEVYAVFTFFIGFGLVGVILIASPYCMEFLNSTWRARMSSMPVWNASIVCFALIIYLLRDWRSIHLVCTFASGIVCLGIFWTPESLRWLVLHGKTSQAQNVLTKIAKVNKRHVPMESLKRLMVETEGNDSDRHYTYLDLFRTSAMRVLMIKLTCLTIAWSVVYDAIGFGIQALPGNFYTNIIVASLIEFPSTLLVGPLATKFGRRRTGILFQSIGIISCASIVVSLLAMYDGNIKDILITSMAFINRSFAQAFIDLMMTYTSELVPTAVRNLTFGFMFFTGRLVCVFVPFLLPRDFPSLVACFAVLMCIQIIATVVLLTLPETKNRPFGDTLYVVKVKETEESEF